MRAKKNRICFAFFFIIVNTNMCNIITANQRIGTFLRTANEMNGTLFISMRSGPFHSIIVYVYVYIYRNVYCEFSSFPQPHILSLVACMPMSMPKIERRKKIHSIDTWKRWKMYTNTHTHILAHHSKSKPFDFLCDSVATKFSTPAHFF